jgi:hypothetical protein
MGYKSSIDVPITMIIISDTIHHQTCCQDMYKFEDIFI